MGSDFIAQYEATKENGAIVADASETFFIDTSDQEGRWKHGSFNYLEIVNDSSNDLWIDLDGLTSRRRKLFARSSLVIEADQNIFWDNVKVTDADSANIAANLITITGRIMKKVRA